MLTLNDVMIERLGSATSTRMCVVEAGEVLTPAFMERLDFTQRSLVIAEVRFRHFIVDELSANHSIFNIDRLRWARILDRIQGYAIERDIENVALKMVLTGSEVMA